MVFINCTGGFETGSDLFRHAYTGNHCCSNCNNSNKISLQSIEDDNESMVTAVARESQKDKDTEIRLLLAIFCGLVRLTNAAAGQQYRVSREAPK